MSESYREQKDNFFRGAGDIKKKNTCLEFSGSQAMPSREIWLGQFLKKPFSQGTSENILTFFSPNLTTPTDATPNAKAVHQCDV